jgi:Rrf2 family iron-sulfur cluster assembly transcriptional regulator
MFLSQTSEYAIRAVACIALRDGKAAIRAKDLSAEISIPIHYLSKVLRRLVKADILMATKGHNGGFVLARPAKRIKLIHVLEAVEVPIRAKHCIFGWRMCNSKEPCVLHYRWSAVNDSFQHWIRTTTLAHIQNDASKANWIVPEKESRVKKLAK